MQTKAVNKDVGFTRYLKKYKEALKKFAEAGFWSVKSLGFPWIKMKAHSGWLQINNLCTKIIIKCAISRDLWNRAEIYVVHEIKKKTEHVYWQSTQILIQNKITFSNPTHITYVQMKTTFFICMKSSFTVEFINIKC